jgi:hypothetical protein
VQVKPPFELEDQHANFSEEQNVKYVLFAYRDEQQWEAMSPRERDDFEAASRSIEQDLRHSRHLLDIQCLQSSPALMVRVLNSKVSLTEGLVVEAKGRLTQLLILRARDLNEAIQVASQMPQARRGLVEVRSIIE